MVSTSVNSPASKSLTADTVCNISEYQEVELVEKRDNTSSDRSDIIPPPQQDLDNSSEPSRAKSKTEYIKIVCETNNSVLSTPEVSSFYDISYCSKV